jgi:hypothetical protein
MVMVVCIKREPKPARESVSHVFWQDVGALAPNLAASAPACRLLLCERASESLTGRSRAQPSLSTLCSNIAPHTPPTHHARYYSR